jgi:hypothetical protein
MMAWFGFLDVAPDPVGIGIVAAVVLLVIGSVALLAVALVVFLWYRKRSQRHLELTRIPADSKPIEIKST